ncbi:MAG: hypothetical protein J7K90_09340 [Desulfuromusa sp.]|nr:hypothetical protein [Desulfuromusa sp.]
MGKQLVSRDNVAQFISHEEKKLYAGQIILTPGAKDYLRENGIAVVYGAQPEKKAQPVPSTETASGENLNSQIQRLLKSDFAITDSHLITEVTQKVMAKLGNRQ